MSFESWKPIPSNNDYEVSSFGRVRSLYYRGGRILKLNTLPSGYNMISISKLGVRTDHYVHRLIAAAFIENPYNKKTVNHKDGNKANNHVLNLEWATHSENNKHAWDIGTRVSKSINRRTVLDLLTGIYYTSLRSACAAHSMPYYDTHKKTSKQKSRFIFI